MTRLRVAVVFDTAGFTGALPLTGAATRTLRLNQYLQQAGCEVRLFLCDLNPQSKPTDRWPFDVTYLTFADMYEDPAVLIEHIRNWSPDLLVMSNTQLLVRWGRQAADAAGCALVYEMHDDEQALLATIGSAQHQYLDAHRLQSAAAQAADAVVTFTPQDAEAADDLGAAAVHVIPCGAEPPPRQARHRRCEGSAAFVGNLFYEPNIRALSYLRRSAKALSAPVDVYGRFPATIARYDTEGIRLHGAVADLNTALATACVGLAPLDSGGGMKLKTLHYMAAGLPVVGTPAAFTGVPEAAEIGLIAKADLSDFVDLTNRLLADAEHRAELGGRGRALAMSTYSWAHIAESAKHAYAGIAAQAGGTGRVASSPEILRLAQAAPYWLSEWRGWSGDGRQDVVARCGSAAVRVTATASQARWLEGHLAPYVQVAQDGETVRDSAAAWTICLDPEQGYGAPITDQRGASAHDVGYRLLLDEDSKTISILPHDPEVELTQCRRLIRSVLRHELTSLGAIHIGAALVSATATGGGIALVGGTRTGKTSTALALLLRGGFDLCANDDLTVVREGDRFTGVGWPRAASIRRETLRRFARPGTALRAAAVAARHPGLNRPQGGAVDRALWLFPDELAAATGSALVPSAPIGLIVFPSFDSKLPEPRLTRLTDPEDVAARLMAAVDALPGRFEPWLAHHFDAASPATVATVCHDLASTVAAYELRQSMHAIEASAALIEELCRDGGTNR